jgi:hypothetical protein
MCMEAVHKLLPFVNNVCVVVKFKNDLAFNCDKSCPLCYQGTLAEGKGSVRLTSLLR